MVAFAFNWKGGAEIGSGFDNLVTSLNPTFRTLHVRREISARSECELRRTHMGTATKAMAWVSIFSTLFMGCYSSVLVDLKRDEKDRLSSYRIKYVVTKDSRKYEFEKPPAVVKDSIVGKVKIPLSRGYLTEQVTIPISDVTEVYAEELNRLGTVYLVLGIAGAVVGLTYLCWRNSFHFSFYGDCTWSDLAILASWVLRASGVALCLILPDPRNLKY